MKKIKYVLFTFILCFISLNTVYADATCVYEKGDFSILCTASSNNLNCKNNSKTGIKLLKTTNLGIKNSDFKDALGNYNCLSKVYLDIELSTNNGVSTLNIKDIYKEDNLCSGETKKCEQISNNTSKSNVINNEKNTSDTSTPTKIESDNDLIKNFCQGTTQGVFTTLGWVFFIIKILVPILLIVFGSIDFAKAVLASKDDEIKKSMKSLVMRTIAGIIIFFIPSILSFIVKLINGNDIYNGTFNDCTQCMLNPNFEFKDGTTCKNLRGN